MNEKAFYLEEFYAKSLLFALVPPTGQRFSDLDSLAHTLRELVRNHSRCILIAAEDVLPKVLRKMGRLAPRQAPPIFDPAQGLRSRPYPPDSAVARIWIGACKVRTAEVAQMVTLKAMHLLGSLGLSNETPLANMFSAAALTMGMADGPTEIHQMQIGRTLLKSAVPYPGRFPTEHLPARIEAAKAWWTAKTGREVVA